MSALSAVRTRRTAAMLVANVVALAALGGMGYAGVNALREYKGATKVSVESLPIPVTPVGMIATVDDDDQLTTVTVMVLSPGTQVGGSIISVPVSSDSTAGGAEVRTPLTQVYAEGGGEAHWARLLRACGRTRPRSPGRGARRRRCGRGRHR